MKKILATGGVVITLIIGLTSSVIAAPPPDIPRKGPPDLEQVIFVHYGKDSAPAKPEKPVKPENRVNPVPRIRVNITSYRI